MSDDYTFSGMKLEGSDFPQQMIATFADKIKEIP